MTASACWDAGCSNPGKHFPHQECTTKILVPNIGSTSLKWRLFDFSNGGERLLHKGGFERVTDYARAIGDCLEQLKATNAIVRESDIAAVGFKTIIAEGITGCVRIDERVLRAMEAYRGLAPAHNPPYITGIRLFADRMPDVPLIALFETAFYQFAPEATMRVSRRQPQIHRGAISRSARTAGHRRTDARAVWVIRS
jgi:acetate kinase